MTTGCASLSAQSKKQPANLTAPCPELPKPLNPTGAEILKWSLETVQAYKDCQLKHKRLVEAIGED